MTDSNGKPLEGQVAKLTFKLFSSASQLDATTFLWGEEHVSVAVRRGVFTVQLGAGTRNVDFGGNPVAATPLNGGVFDGSARFLQVKVNSDPALSPVTKLGSVPFAIRADTTTRVWDPSTQAGLDLSGLDTRNDARYLNVTGDSVAGNLSVSGQVNVGDVVNAGRLYVGSGLMQGGELILTPDSQPALLVQGALFLQAQGKMSITCTEFEVLANPAASQPIHLRGRTSVGGDLHVNGTLEVTGAKSFVAPHPKDATKEIVYCSLEGPECSMYVRGSAQLASGKVTITLPEHFSLLAVATGMTVQVTPTGDCKGLYVKSRAVDKVEVRECQGGTSNVTFDYMVFAKRKGTENDPVVRPKK